MLLFVVTELTLFCLVFSTYFYIRFQHAQWPPPGFPKPEIATPLILALVLASMSFPLALAARSAGAGRVRAAWWLLAIPLVVQIGYFAMQVKLFDDDLQKFGPGQEAYGSVYYLLLAVHHFHVLVGILLSAFLLARLLKGLNRYRATGVQSTVFYWYFVNLIGLVVVAVELSAA
jgi:heme/copper-type cytochrome/quinol oxidase subunit 3